MVYRQNATTSVYYRVPNSVTTFIERSLSQEDCLSLHLNQTEQFDIQPNDILAACMIDIDYIIYIVKPLRVLSRSRAEALQITTPNYDYCTEEQLLSLDMQILNSETRDFLLVEALIRKFVFITLVSICDYCIKCTKMKLYFHCFLWEKSMKTPKR